MVSQLNHGAPNEGSPAADGFSRSAGLDQRPGLADFFR
jgi:hypothetical protein